MPWIMIAIIFAFSAWAAWFSHKCLSDGCMGIVYPIGAALVVLGVQAVVVIPFNAIRRWRGGEPFAAATLQWIIASVAAFWLPPLVVK